MKTSLATIMTVSALSFAGALPTRAAEHTPHAQAWTAVKQAVAVLHPTTGNKCQGKVVFTQEGETVKIVAHIEGLTPGQKHAFHIHQYGDCSAPDGMSAGGHYNPENHPHGLPASAQRHAGDLGNLEADSNGKAHLELTVNNISVAGTKNPIVGRGVIVHAKIDDGGQPVGNAGGRIGCGVIGVASAGEKK
ncbi:MAG: superoxide dismutase family protein [Verrucomicrobiales bacterium]|nr:superoxide dismutase family protein [Verrucomicrobiales bacterium]